MSSAEWRRFADASEALLESRGKIDKRSKIALFLRQMRDDDAKAAALSALYFSGAPFAEGDGRVLNVGWRLMSTAVAEISKANDEVMTASYRQHGDFGSSAADLVVGHAPAGDPLGIHDVALAFASLAATGVQAHKLKTLVDLFSRTRPNGDTNLEAKYLAKLILGDMRTGVKAALVEEAIAEAANVELAAVRRAVTLTGDLVRVAEMAFEGSLEAAKMKLFHPLGFMLASPADSVEEATNRFVEVEGKVHAQIEDKYDGIRAQLHFGDASEPGRVAIFSRTRGEITRSFPEIAETLEKADTPAILDGEILGWDLKAERALPFSSLQTRLGRKKVTDAIRKETPVIFMAFDVLFAGEALTLEKSLSERRALLESIVERERAAANAGKRNVISRGQMSLFDAPSAAPPDRLRVSPAFRVESPAALDEAYRAARARGNEGVMLKALDSKYEPGRRGHAWTKLKRELATLDVVVTAAEYGHGKRAKVLSDYTFAVRDGESLVNVGKAYSGLTDAEILELTSWFLDHTIEDRGHVRSVEPFIVLEVAFNNVMKSDRHDSGFALRFPRIVRIRQDMLAAEIDTLERVNEIYEGQPDKPSAEQEV